MAKKYSVQVEEDEVVSIEVDGVRYTRPEDIPDERDRKKIEALISSTLNDDEEESDEAFEKQFQQDLREVEKQTSSLPKLLGAIFLSVALIMLAIFAFSSYSAYQTARREVSAPGRVVDLVVRDSRDSKTNRVTTYSYPVVEFAPPNQRVQRVELAEGSSPPAYQVGDEVTVLYDPQQPREARIKSFASDLMLWLLPGITLLIGAVFGAVGAAMLLSGRKGEELS